MERSRFSSDRRFPRAPTQEAWDRLTPEERRAVVSALPASLTEEELSPPEGDLHFGAKVDALQALRSYYGRKGKSIYLAAELAVYYPDAPRFAPDVLAVFDVDPKQRMRWVCSEEGKGLDWVLEVHVGGDRKKDAERNVTFYAELGIPEYFIADFSRQRVFGFRLDGSASGRYAPILPQEGRIHSAQLDLELWIEEGRLRFFHAGAELPTPVDLSARLSKLVQEVQDNAEAALREERSKTAAQESLAEVERGRADRAEAQLAELRAQLARLKPS